MAKPVYATNDVPPPSEWNEWLVNVNWARKTALENVISSTTLQNDDHLFVPVQANAVYFMTALIKYDGLDAADLKILFRLPTGATLNAQGTALVSGATSQQDIQTLPIFENASTVWGVLGAGATLFGTVTGVVVVGSTAGNVQVEWAQNASAATPTRLLANSFLNLDRRE